MVNAPANPVAAQPYGRTNFAVRTRGQIFSELMERAGQKPEDVIRDTNLGRNTVYDILGDKRETRKAKLEAMAAHFGKSLAEVEEMRRAPQPPPPPPTASMHTIYVSPTSPTISAYSRS
jgi:hypothetical protein